MPVVRRFDKTHRKLRSPQAVRRFDQAHRKLRSPQVFIRSRLRRPRLIQAEVRRLAQRILTQASRGQAPSVARISERSELRREPVPCELSLDFIGDRRMRRLNRQYRGRDRPTDVLAFPMRHASVASLASSGRGLSRPTRQGYPLLRGKQQVPDAMTRRASSVAPHMLGDVVISVPTAARQAAARGYSVEHELTVLLVHGILHLCGYDHERGERAACRMRRKERAILQALRPIPKLFRKRST